VQHATLGVNRRDFIRLTGSALASLSIAQACAPSLPGATPPAPTSAPAAPRPSAVTMPAYVPFQGPRPDFAASADGVVPPGYMTFPKDLIDTVAAPVGKGEEINFFTYSINPPPPALDQNPAWQTMNKEIGVSLKFGTVALQDWEAKLATMLANGDMPDLLTLEVLGRLMPNELDFLARQCADLTAYVSGDSIKGFPNLANLTPSAWKNCVKGGKFYALPRLTNSVGSTMIVKQNLLDERGIKEIKNKEDFLKLLQDIRGAGNMYGIGGVQANSMNWIAGVFRAPHRWKNDGGKLTRNYETPEFKSAVEYLRTLWDAGVVSPETPTFQQNAGAQAFYASKFAMYPTNFFAFGIAWDRLLRIDKDFRLSALLPFGHDGGKGVVFQEWGGNQLTVLKKSDPDRVKLLLGVLNYLAAPFGSREHLANYFGVQDVEFQFDARGNPVLTEKGLQDVQYLATGTIISPPPYLFDAFDPNFVSVAHPIEMAAHDMAITDPTIGLFSNTEAVKGATLALAVEDGINNIIFGRSPMTSYDQLVKDWRTNGGDQIRAELQDQLALLV
jgi:putative aldouronate transport system substrate-binding protein